MEWRLNALRGTARRKVYTVAMTGMSTQEFGSALKSEMREEPELFHGMLGIEWVMAIPGGVPIRLVGQLVGAVAVSGGASARIKRSRKPPQ